MGRRTELTDLFRDIIRPRRLRRAWESVSVDDGAAGSDGVTVSAWSWDWEARLAELRDAVRLGRYRPAPLRSVRIPKPAGGFRDIHIATVTDRVLLRSVHDVLEDAIDRRFLRCAYGYRPGRGVADAVREVVKLREQRYLWLLDADIDDFFGSIPHEPLLAVLEAWTGDLRLVGLVRLWLRSAAGPHSPGRGLPLGLAISPILSNLYLHRLDETVTAAGWPMVRYADDFCVFDRTEPGIHEARVRVAGTLAELGLAFNPEKTAVTHFQDGFVFLGVEFSRHGQRLRVDDRWLPVAPGDPLWYAYRPPGYA